VAQFEPGAITGISVYPWYGANITNVERTTATALVTIILTNSQDPGLGDQVNLSPTGHLLDNLQGNVTITNGGGGTSTLTEFDQNDPSIYSDSYDITGSTTTRTGSALVTYSSIQSLVLYGGSGNDFYQVNGTAAGTPVTINAGAGNNTFSLSPAAHNLTNLQGHLTVTGGGGTNILYEFDQNNTSSNTFTITGTTTTRDASALITYSSIHGLVLNGGSGNVPYNIESTAAGTLVAVNAGAGNNTFNLSPTAKFLDNLKGNITVSGGGGINTLTEYDQNDPYNDTYTITATTTTRTASALVTYSSLPKLVLYGGSGNVTYSVLSTASGSTTVTGGAGNNTVNVGNAGSVQGIGGNLYVNDPTGHTTLNVDDSADPTIGTFFHQHSGNYEYGVLSYSGTQSGFNLFYKASDTTSLTVQTAAVGATVNFAQAVVPTTLIGHGNNTTVNLINPYDNIAPLTVTNPTGHTTLKVDDTSDITSRTVTISGSAITGFGTAAINYQPAGLAALTVSGGGYGNTFTVTATGAGYTTTLNSGSGSDLISVSSSSNTLDGIQGPLTVNGQGGTNTLYLNDPGTTAAKTYTLTATTLARTGAALITFGNVQSLTVNGGSGGNTINVQGTASGTAVTFSTDAGSDAITVGSAANTLDGIQGGLIINGQAGTNTLTFNDQGATTAKTYTLTPTTLARTGAALITFFTVQGLTLNCGSGGNTFNIPATVSGTPVTVNAGAGNDTIAVGSATNTLDTIQGALTINGQAGTDTLAFNDQGATNSKTYTLTATTLAIPGIALMTFGTVENLTLNGASGGNTVSVQGTAAGTAVTVNSGAGNDTITVGSPSNTLDGILGPLTINGQGGTNTLAINDQGATTSKTYILTATTLARTGAALITYGTVQGLTLNCGSGGNPITVSNTASGYATFLNSGAGNDTVNVLNTTGPFVIDCGGGSNNKVTVGNAGSVQGILGELDVKTTAAGSSYSLTVDDSADTAVRGVDVTNNVILGLAPNSVPIYYLPNLSALNIETKMPNGGGIHIDDTPQSSNGGTITTLDNFNPTPCGVAVTATTGALVINNHSSASSPNPGVFVGKTDPLVHGTLANIKGTVTVTDIVQRTDLVIDDGKDTGYATVTVTDTYVQFQSTGFPNINPKINYVGKGLVDLLIEGAGGGSTFNVLGTAAFGTRLQDMPGTNQVNVQSTGATGANAPYLEIHADAGDTTITVSNSSPSGPTVKNMVSNLTIFGRPDLTKVILNDANTGPADTVTVTPTQVGAASGDNFFGPGGSLSYSGVNTLTVYTTVNPTSGATMNLTTSTVTTFNVYVGPVNSPNGTLIIHLGGATNPVNHPDPVTPGKGYWTFNAPTKNINYWGVKTMPPPTTGPSGWGGGPGAPGARSLDTEAVGVVPQGAGLTASSALPADASPPAYDLASPDLAALLADLGRQPAKIIGPSGAAPTAHAAFADFWELVGSGDLQVG
jgi:hypothetical protein